ncbi:MAG: hypothetical protein FD180_684 [Planctomycetota bacterium]|nr:MAG: hypothetical protein FD180_684 [Planctomycetota bacterium]
MHRRPLFACLYVTLAAIPAFGEAPPGWVYPSEAMAAKGDRMPWPVEVVRVASGGVGVFVFEREVGLTLRWSKDGRAPWKVILLPNGPAGEPVVEGDRVEIPLADEDDKSISVAVFDLAQGKDLSRTRIPGELKRPASFSRLVAREADRFLAWSTAPGDIFFSQTEDGGKKWRPLAVAGRTAARGDSCCPPLLIAADGPHLFFVGDDDKISHKVADPAGVAWKDAAAVPLPAPEQGLPALLAGAQSGSQFHLVLLTGKFRSLYTWSDDAGAHWAPWTVAASPSQDVLGSFDVAATFRLKARGKSAVLCWTERGKREGDPYLCRMLASHTSGGKWSDFSPVAGIRGSSGLAAAYLGEDGGITAAFATAPNVTTGTRYVLVRQALKGADPGEIPTAEWWGK